MHTTKYATPAEKVDSVLPLRRMRPELTNINSTPARLRSTPRQQMRSGNQQQPRRGLDRSCHITHRAGEVVISMRPVSVFAKGPAGEIEQLEADLHGQWRQATRAVMVLLSLHGLPPAQIAELLNCHPATVRRWVSRFNSEGLAGLADRPRSGRPRLGR
jgi:hypothetical protein